MLLDEVFIQGENGIFRGRKETGGCGRRIFPINLLCVMFLGLT
jgi:hypothetical protein